MEQLKFKPGQVLICTNRKLKNPPNIIIVEDIFNTSDGVKYWIIKLGNNFSKLVSAYLIDANYKLANKTYQTLYGKKT